MSERKTSEGKREEPAGPAARTRAVTYCIVPRALATKLHEPLRRHFADDPRVEVIVERRGVERRSLPDRRAAGGEGKSAAKTPTGGDRRRVRSVTGRRVADRRASLVAVEAPPLPRKARPHVAKLEFVERAEPGALHEEDLDSARLVMEVQAGSEQAFSTLYTRYFDRVYTYLRIAIEDEHEAEDLAQQAFTNVFEALSTYEYRGKPFRAWIFTIARNLAVSYLRSIEAVVLEDPAELERLRELSEDPEEFEEAGLPTLSWISDPELLMFFERLPLAQRQVLLLRFLLDMSHEQIAETLGRTNTDVRSLHHRAVKFLRKRLEAIGRVPKSDETDRNGWQRRDKQARVLRNRRYVLVDKR